MGGIIKLGELYIELDDIKNAQDTTGDFQVILYSPEPATRADLPQKIIYIIDPGNLTIQ